MFTENIYSNLSKTAAQLLATLKRDVPFETEEDILKAHDRMTQTLYQQYCTFREKVSGVSNTAPVETETPKAVSAAAPVAKVETPAALSKPLATSDAAVLAMVTKAVEASATKEACEELKSKILKATKLSMTDQSALIGKLEAKIQAL